jgi:hypothetical protein
MCDAAALLCVSPAATHACRHPRCMLCLHCKRARGLMDSGGTGASKARARVRPPRAVHATARPNMCALLLLQRAVDYRANRHICEAAGCRSRHEACSGAGGAAILLGERNPLARLSGTHPRPAPSASTPCQLTRRSPRLRVGNRRFPSAVRRRHVPWMDGWASLWRGLRWVPAPVDSAQYPGYYWDAQRQQYLPYAA